MSRAQNTLLRLVPSSALSALIVIAAAGCKPEKATETGASANAQTQAQPAAPASGDTGEGGAATDFTLRDIEGRNVRLSDFKGQVVLIDFWATWCIPCEAEIPHLQRLYEQYKDRGLVVLGISMDGPETIANVPSFVSRYGLTFPVLLDEETRVVGVYNPKRTAPLSILIDKNGKVFRVRQGYSAGEEQLIFDDVKKLFGG